MHKPRGRTGPGSSSDWKAFAVGLILVLAPLPFGSVYSQAWVVWGLSCGILGTLTLWSASRSNKDIKATPEIVAGALLWLGLILYLALQSLPAIVPGWDSVIDPAGAQLSVSPLFSSMMLLRQATYFVLAVTIYWLGRTQAGRRVILGALFLAGNLYALYGLFASQTGDTILGLPKWAYLGSVTGPFVNRNSFATYLSLSAMVSLGMAAAIMVNRSRRGDQTESPQGSIAGVLICVASYFLMLVTIVATQSRMGLFACLCGSITIAGVSLLLAGRLKAALYALPLIIGAIGGAVYLTGEGLLTRVEANGFELASRLELYKQVLTMIEMRPWTGWGGGSFEIAFRTVQQEALNSNLLWDRAHNSYLALWSELGVIFGSALILVIVLTAVLILRRLATATRSLQPLLIGIGAIIVGAVHSLVDFSLEIPAIAMQFTALLALAATAAAGWSRSRRREAKAAFA